MKSFNLIVYLLSFSHFTTVYGWGVVGHEVVATIAQIHLFPSTLEALKLLLPNSGGQIATIAAWADRVRGIPALSWTGELHYTSPNFDHPPQACYFGEKGWKTDHDVLHAISNFTQKLIDNPADGLALRLLVHFVADTHQPLHLTSRERGGNGDFVIFEGRRTNLHALWDGLIVTKKIREQHNYTRPVPSEQIEGSLRGTIYDSYIRFILWEGARVWWNVEDWLECPPVAAVSSRSTSLVASAASRLSQFLFRLPSSSRSSGYTNSENDVESVVCPNHWAQETHQFTCSRVFPANYDNNAPAREVNTKEYYSPIVDENIVEMLLLQAGIRLAATLNTIFASKEEIAEFGLNGSPIRKLY